MTREELKKMAMRYAHDELKDNHASVEKIVAAAFLNGIDHAEHPDVSADIAATHAYERGRKDAIDEACSWLRRNLTEHYADEPFAHKCDRPISGHITFYEGILLQLIKEFKKAMRPTIPKMETVEKGGEE